MLHVEERNRKDTRSPEKLTDDNHVKLIFMMTVEINGLELRTITQTYAAIFVVKGYSSVSTFNDLRANRESSFFYYVGILHVYLALTIGLRVIPLTASMYRYKA